MKKRFLLSLIFVAVSIPLLLTAVYGNIGGINIPNPFEEGIQGVPFDFELQSLAGGTTKCKVKTTQLTNIQGDQLSTSSQFVGSPLTGTTPIPLAFTASENLKQIYSYMIQLKAFCDNNTGGTIYVLPSSYYTLQVTWTNPDGKQKQYTSQSVSQATTIKISGSEAVIKSFFVSADRIDPLLLDFPTKYPVTLVFRLFGEMHITEGLSSNLKKWKVDFAGTPISTQSRIIVEKIREPSTIQEQNLALASIEISEIKTVVGDKRLDQAGVTLDTFSTSPSVIVRGIVTKHTSGQLPPSVEIFKCSSQTSCTQIFLPLKQMAQTGTFSSATQEFRADIRFPQATQDGLYMVKMTMPGRTVVDTAYIYVLNIDTQNKICQQTSSGTPICTTAFSPIKAKVILYYENDFENYAEGLVVKSNIVSGYITEKGAVDTVLQTLAILNPQEGDKRRNDLEAIRITALNEFATPNDIGLFKEVKRTDMKIKYDILINGLIRATITKDMIGGLNYGAQGAINQFGQIQCGINQYGQVIPCPGNRMALAYSTISVKEIEDKLERSDTGNIVIKATVEGTYQLTTKDGVLVTGKATGATYEFSAIRSFNEDGKNPPPGGGEQCQSTDQDVPCKCPEGYELQYSYFTFKFECQPKPTITEEEECIARGADYKWNTSTNLCDYIPKDPPPEQDPRQLCESQGYVYDPTKNPSCSVPPETPPPDCSKTNSCPLPQDTDTDGVPDATDKCPTIKATVDKDGDGCEDVTDDGKITPTGSDPEGKPGITAIAECDNLPFLICVEAMIEEILNKKEETTETTFLGEYGFDTTTWYLVGGIIVIGIIVALINRPRIVYRRY